jgi:hypothetical protein
MASFQPGICRRQVGTGAVKDAMVSRGLPVAISGRADPDASSPVVTGRRLFGRKHFNTETERGSRRATVKASMALRAKRFPVLIFGKGDSRRP